LSSITKKGEIESASRPLMGFGELNDNMIKGLTLYLRYHEQGFIYVSICVSIYVLTHVSRNQIKEVILLNVKQSVKINNETSIHAMTINGFYSWLGTFAM